MRTIVKTIIIFSLLLGVHFTLQAQNELVGSWPFNDGTANDESGNNNHGTVNGAALTTGRLGNEPGAFYFDGVNDYINCGSSEPLDENWNQLSIHAWIKIPANPSKQESIVSKGSSSGSNNFNLSVETDGRIRFWLSDVNLTYSTTAICDDNWHLVSVVWDGTNNYLYIDGELENTISNTPTITQSGSPVLIGSWNTAIDWYFNGSIDDVLIYNKALSANEIASSYSHQQSSNIKPVESLALSSYQNMVHVTTPTQEISQVGGRNYSSIEEVQYFDGLGRPVQSIQIAASPTGKDVVQHIAYDEYGRDSKKYLPYISETAGGAFVENAEAIQYDFYQGALSTSAQVATDTDPWSVTVFEESPLNRVMKQGAPGADWQAMPVVDDHAVHFSYETNTVNEVVKYEIFNGDTLISNGYYASASLYKNKTRDENGVWSVEYKDQLEQVILKVSDSEGLLLKTHYVYDNYGLLRYVIPPKAVKLIETNGITPEILNDLCYSYEYDARKRMVEKKLPGADPVYMIYDLRDRLILTQDGNMRLENKWMYTKYDKLNRPIITGTYADAVNLGLDAMQTYATEQIDTIFAESYDGVLADQFGYTNNAFPQVNTDILTVTYYDNYDFDVDTVDTYSNVREYVESVNTTDYPITEINYAVKGQVTGTLTKVLGTTNHYLLSVNFYDDKYRVIRNYAENYLGGDDLLLSKYDFVGTVLKTKQIHYKDANTDIPVVINQRMIYDHAFRLTEVYHQIGDNAADEILMAKMEYNELGQLIEKQLHETAPGNFLQDVDFEYNIRGWLTKINDPADLYPDTNSDNDLFAMQLAYNNPITGLSSELQYNGNISAILWGNKDEFNTDTLQGYGFTYDAINRIKTGNYERLVQSTWTNQLSFDMSIGNYDENGNILDLQRYGMDNSLIDNLSYTYNNTNQLQSVADASANAMGFDDGNTSGSDYIYDNNGNLIVDHNNGIANISYNYLNLPQGIDFGNGNKISYIYDAAGVKHAKLVSDASAGYEYTYYMGNMEYNNAQSLEYIHTDEGRVRLAGSDYVYDYYLKDHLGNTRVVFNEGGGTIDVEQVTNYYPFGMRFNQTNLINNQTTDYLYNGKELQEEHGLDWYDYGWRHYDPALGRFTTIDPHAENYLSWTPYNYVANNPILLIDPDGRDWYQSENGNVMWQKGSDDVDGYTNIGANYTQDVGDGASITYTQNEATSMTFTGAEDSSWESQIANGTHCRGASEQMLGNEGVETAGRGSEEMMTTAQSNGRAGDATANAATGIEVVDQALESGDPIMVGVDYSNGNKSANNDGTTDHFIVVSSKTETLSNGSVTGTTYNFFDPRTSHGPNSTVNYGTSSTNTLTVTNNKMTGSYNHGTSNYSYTVTTVRRNK